MDDAFLVSVLHCLRDLPEKRQGFIHGNDPARDTFSQRFPFHELHDEKGRALGFFEPIERGDTRMVQRREKLRFTLESQETIFVLRKLRGKQLDRHFPPQLGIVRAIDLAHPALADLFDDFVVRKRFT